MVENSGDAEEGQRAGGREVVVMKMGWPCWVGVVTEDLEVQRRFYRDMLGLVELAAGPGWIQFDFGEQLAGYWPYD